MPPPPPPPPPAPLSPFVQTASNSKTSAAAGDVDRSALLKQIRHGAPLKKAITNDKSAPLIGKPASNQGVVSKCEKPVSNNENSICNNGPVGLGGLFAQGMPKLKPTNKTFLEGGNYKSQFSPRQIAKSEPNLTPIKSEEKTESKTLESSSGKSCGTMKNGYFTDEKEDPRNSKLGLTKNSYTNNSYLHSPQVKSNEKSPHTNFRGPPPPPPPANKKPTFTDDNINATSPKPCHKSVARFQHKFDGSNLSGSEPNLNSVSFEKLQVPSKPNIANNLKLKAPFKPTVPPRGAQSATSSPVKPHVILKPKSYDDSVVPKSYERNIPVNNLNINSESVPKKNLSEPSNLNVLTSGHTPVTRQYCRPLARPGGTLPNQTTGRRSPQPHRMRDLPPPPPPPVVVSHPTLPPPPPPRVMPVLAQSTLKTNVDGNAAEKAAKKLQGMSEFESRFISSFHRISEFPKPEGFSKTIKAYPSKAAEKQSANARKNRQPPSAPPPPPPMVTG